MRALERYLLFPKKTIELSYWRDNISFRTVPPTEICCLHSQVIFLTFEEILRHIKNLARGTKTYRDLVASSAASLPEKPEKVVPLAFKQLFYCETRVRGQFVASPSPLIFDCVLASEVRKIWIKMPSQRDEASRRLFKHHIVISLHSFL